MIDGVHAIGAPATVYYVVVVLIGVYILMNLLVAVLLQLFAEAEAADDSASAEDPATDGEPAADAADDDMVVQGSPLPSSKGVPPSPLDGNATVDVEWAGESGSLPHGRDADARVQFVGTHDLALGCLPPDHPVRRRCCELAEHPTIDVLLMVAVVVSSLMLAIDTPRVPPTSVLATMLRLANYAFTALFFAEAVVKAAAYGLIATPRAYLKNGWNVLDFAILLISLGAIASEALPQLSFLRSLRALRVLRPLRLLSRNEGMKLVLISLFEALPAVSNVVGVMMALQMVFAILGMQVRCSTPWMVRNGMRAWSADAAEGPCT